jgi:hypothetical protein
MPLLLLVMVSSAFGMQQTGTSPKAQQGKLCYLDDLAYSPGAQVQLGNQVIYCNTNQRWIDHYPESLIQPSASKSEGEKQEEEFVPVCYLGDKAYSFGHKVSEDGSSRVCRLKGVWATSRPDSPKPAGKRH